VDGIHGKDIGDTYHLLNDFEKRDIAKGLAEIQKKVSVISPIGLMKCRQALFNEKR